MKIEARVFLIPLLLVPAAFAQADGDADRAPVKADVVGVDGGAWVAPVLRVDAERITVTGTAHAMVAVFLRPRTIIGDADMAPVDVLFGGGALDAAGRLVLPLPPDDGVRQPAPILLRALQLRPDGRVDVSPIEELRRPADRAPELKVSNALSGEYDVRAELSATDSLPPQIHLHLAVRVPTTGYALRLAARIDAADRIELRYELMEPDPAMRHLTVLETLRASADLGEASGAIEVSIRKVAFAKAESTAGAID